MNRLKCVFGTHVPHTVLSHIHKRHHSDAQLLRIPRLNPSRSKTVINVRNVDTSGHHRIELNGVHQRRPKSDAIKKISSGKTSSEEYVQKRRKLMCQPARAREKYLAKSALCSKNLRNAVVNMADEEAGSYARMIARYTVAMYSKPDILPLKNDNGAAMSNRIRRSPFSTASVISIKSFRAASPARLTPDANFSTETSAMRCDSRNTAQGFVEAIGGNKIDLERKSSYASMIEKYSNIANIYSHVVETGIPRRRASTRLEDTSEMSEDAKSVGGRFEEIVEGSKKNAVDGPAEAKGSDAVKKREDTQSGWTTRDVIKDPRRIAAEKDDTDAKSQEKRMLQAVNQQAHWLDRVVEAHKKQKTDRKSASGRTSRTTNENVTLESAFQPEPKEDRIGSSEMSGSKPTNPISEYIRRSPVSNSRPTQSTTTNSTQTTATSSSAKQPQIELRMTPSNNESVVAINVDELSAKTAGTNDHLSVVISSKKNNVADKTNMDSRSDFDSMQISISEDTVPVKQIAFSINGKPVSELKSILARADKLDVFSSKDKVEIRIPSKGSGRTVNQPHVAKIMSNPSPVLNLHINAKFNEPRMQRPTGAEPEASPRPGSVPTQNPIPLKMPNVLPPKGQGMNGVNNSNSTVNAEKLEESVKNQQTDVSTSDMNSMNRHRESYTAGDNNSAQEIMKIETWQDTSKNREPSNIIPWWSSEGPFKKIKKKDITKEISSKTAIVSEEIGDSIKESRSSDETQETEPSLQPKHVIPSNVTEPLKITPPRINEEKTEATSHPQNAVFSNPVESLKTTSPKNVEEKSEIKEKPAELLEASRVQVKSPQRWVPIKATSTIKTSKQAKQLRLMKKNVKYRTRNVKPSTISKRSSDTSINFVPPPEVVKFVAVSPKTIHVEPEAKKIDEKKDKTEGEMKKIEAVEIVRDGDETVQNSNMVNEGTDLEKSANRSAGVSAKSPSAAGGSGLERGKGRPESKTAGTVGKLLPGSGEHVLDRRMMEILKTIKPIEKRKDGTLIDYGIKVSSRKPSKKVQIRPTNVPVHVNVKKVVSVASEEPKSIAKISRKEDSTEVKMLSSQNEINRTEKMPFASKEGKSVSNQLKLVKDNVQSSKAETKKSKTSEKKVVEPVKLFSEKKNASTEPKTVIDQRKIVEPVKISSVKNDELESEEMSRPLEIDKLERTSSMKKHKNIPHQPRHGMEHKPLSGEPSEAANAEVKKLSESQIKVLFKKTDRKLLPKGTTSVSESKKTSDNQSRNYFEVSKAHITTADSVKSKEENPSKLISELPDKKVSATFSEESEEAKNYNSQPTIKKLETTSPGNLEKRLKETGAAPFEGTINFSSVNEDKKTRSKKNKVESAGSEETPRFKGPTVGPAGFKSSRSFTMHSKTSMNKITALVASSVEKKYSEEDNIKMFNKKHCLQGQETERPEKGLLYSSWLQRFKNSVDDDKIM